MAGEFDTGGAREHAHAALGEAIGGITWHRPVLMHRTDVDDATATTLLDHLLGCELRCEEGALEIDCQHLVVLILSGVEDRAARFNARVVDHNIQSTELAYRRIDELLQVGELAHISIDANRLVAEPSDLLLKRLGGLRMSHVIDDDAGVLLGEFEHNRLTNPAVATGNDGNLVLQRHGQPLDIRCGSPSGMERAETCMAQCAADENLASSLRSRAVR